MPGVLEQLLRLLEVLLPLRYGGIGGGEDGREGAVVAEIGTSLEEPVDQRLTVDSEGQRLAHALVRERLLVRPHVRPSGAARRGAR